MTGLDWGFVLAMLAIMITGVLLSRSHMQSVADFLAAGRSAGRYLLTVSEGVSAVGAITIVGFMEMNYVAGFAMTWWGFTMGMVVLLVTVSGWIVYRFRQTRALTLAEFFERRYSRKFRVFAGLIAFLSGIINFGIFPAVGARFFIHFCELPQAVAIAGMEISTFPLVMLALLSLALFFVFVGGQIAVIVTDFLQGVFVNIVFLILVGFLLSVVDWTQIFSALAEAPSDASLINPFKTGHVEDFNFWYFLIGIFGVLYGTMSWQGTQAYNSSATNAHEAKMGRVLTNWRDLPRNLLLLVVPIVAYTVMHHADFAGIAGVVDAELATAGSEAVQNQLRVPLVLQQLLPRGLIGAFAAVMVAAFISTHDTYLHSWGTIFIQDVLLPLRGRPLSPTQHIRALRLAILGVALFIFCFSLLFQQSAYIFLFFAITGAIFAGGSGAVIIGGLYWKRGTTEAAWAAMITGASIAVGGILIHQAVDDFPINGQMFWGGAMILSSIVYILVSLLGPRREYDLDRLLHRGKYRLESETRYVRETAAKGWRILFMDRQFTRGDRVIYVTTYAWTVLWAILFIAGTVYNLGHDVPDSTWARFWQVYVWIHLGISAVVILWFTGGGIADLSKMLARLRTLKRDPTDDGSVGAQNEAAAETEVERDR